MVVVLERDGGVDRGRGADRLEPGEAGGVQASAHVEFVERFMMTSTGMLKRCSCAEENPCLPGQELGNGHQSVDATLFTCGQDAPYKPRYKRRCACNFLCGLVQTWTIAFGR